MCAVWKGSINMFAEIGNKYRNICIKNTLESMRECILIID